MTIQSIEATSLWKTAFSSQNIEQYGALCQRLQVEHRKFREKVGALVRKIAEVLPDLTIHDLTHLDALWETADLIAGPDYPLNPLEAFVFGGAVLLHDSAMCWEAYADGQAGVRSMIAWTDAYAVECERAPDADDVERKAAADFSALRTLHAHQASSLCQKKWLHHDTQEEIFLIDDGELRTHLGRLIGLIASSHHWNIDDLSSKLTEQFNAPSLFPTEWCVDPIKIACLLRCADAAHINNARAPDFLYALARRKGISRLHWQAQNRMMGPSSDAGDSLDETILYTSSTPFKEADADAWWIAYDAASVVDAELRSSNTLLRSRGRGLCPEFKIRRVKGVHAVDEMVRLLEVEDWNPCNAQIHVSNIETLVKNLGGEKLYGDGCDKAEVVIRELIQNARDAIVARRYVEPDFEGNISIQLRLIDHESWLYIEDNGVGMSYDVMTGSLLDFGSSFWKSSLVLEEFPGLRSSKFRSVGRFGIGFYSVFMIADSVTIVSKKWDKGLDKTNTVIFKNGLTFRPIVRHGRSDDFSMHTSTQIRLKLKPGILENEKQVTIKSGYMGIPDLNSFLPDFIAAMVSGLDVNVTFSSPTFLKQRLHEGHTGAVSDGEKILRQLSLSQYQQHPEKCSDTIAKNHHRLRTIKVDGRTIGFAAISTDGQSGQLRLGLKTIGGLATSLHGGYSSEFLGYINYRPGSARRDAVAIDAPQECIDAWYLEQLDILNNSPLSDYERCIAAANACGFNSDPMSIGRLYFAYNGQDTFANYDTIASMAENIPVVILKSHHLNHVETHHKISQLDGKILIRPLTNGHYLSLDFDGDSPKNPNSMIGCLHRAVLAKGRIPSWSVTPSMHESSIFGSMHEMTLTSKV